ncbi:hypothetical protein PAPHI01_0559 [Pancytospora philotis]|nr:hypothetical protein PAPHI01_0559 [Pancytospora philotis]
MAWKNTEELFRGLKTHEVRTVEDVLQYVERPKMVIRIVSCAKCRRPMRKKKETEALIDYQCNRCDTFKRLLKFRNIFNARLNILQLLRFLVYFALNIETGVIAAFLDVSKNTVRTYVVALRGLVQQRSAETSVLRGGPGQRAQMFEELLKICIKIL